HISRSCNLTSHATDSALRLFVLPLFSLLLRWPPRPTLFPYTTLFRSGPQRSAGGGGPRPGGIFCRLGRAGHPGAHTAGGVSRRPDRKSTRLNSSHVKISYAVFCLKKKRNCQRISVSRSVR